MDDTVVDDACDGDGDETLPGDPQVLRHGIPFQFVYV